MQNWSVFFVCYSDLLRLTLEETALQKKKEEEELRRELERNLVQYRAIHQRADDSRDADINYGRQEAPDDRISVSDSALGPASMQVFLVRKYSDKWHGHELFHQHFSL